jgi:plasmid stabilization system protein ParE
MKAQLHEEAEREIQQAFEYFESRQPGLGIDFVQRVDDAIAKVCENPDRWPRLGSSVRRCQTDRFKYGIIYHVLGNEIEVLAVMDLRRKPGYWRQRLRK